MDSAVLNFDCPACGQNIEAPSFKNGAEITCPACQHAFRAPVLPATQSTADDDDEGESYIDLAEKLEASASSWTIAAIVLVCLGVLAAALLAAAGSFETSVIVVAAFLFLAIVPFVIAQFCHLRASQWRILDALENRQD